MPMEDINGKVAGAQESKEKGVDWAISRNQARRTVPAGDDFRGAGQRLQAATASVAVRSTALLPGMRYKWRCLDAAAGTHYFRCVLGSGVDQATVASWPVQQANEGYLYVPTDGTWDTVSFFATNLTGFLHLMESKEKDEQLL